MDDSRAELIEQFAIETQQHVDEIEPILLAAEWDAPDKAAVSALFRCFHSIKGLSRLLELQGLETVAHHAETLLGDIRAARLAFAPPIQNLLLKALDAIRLLRDRAIDGGQDGAPPAGLLAALHAATVGGAGLAAESGDTATDALALHHDGDTLVYFAELLAECLPNLAGLVDGAGNPGEALEDAETLVLAAERLGLNGMRRRAQDLTQVSDRPVIDCMAAILADAASFGRMIGHDAGVEAVLQRLAQPLQLARQEAALELAYSWDGPAQRRLDLAKRLLLLSFADPVSALLVQAAASSDTHILAQAQDVARQLADGSDRSDGTAAECLRGLMLARTTLPAASQKYLTDRGVDLARLGAIGADPLARLASALTGGDQHLLAVTALLPDPASWPDLLSWFDATLEPVAAATADGKVTMLIVAGKPADAVKADILAAHPGVTVECHRVDLQFVDHPWSHAAARVRGANNADENQVRVPVEILDRLFGRIGEFFHISSALNVLVVDSQVPSVLHRLNEHVVQSAPEFLPAMELLQRQQSELGQIEAEVHRLVSLIHEATLGLRVIPLDVLFGRYPRMIRDLSREQKKQVRFEAQSEGIKVDKGMTELLGDPLMHILRNAVDHGIEPAAERQAAGKPAAARISVTAAQHANRVVVSIADDGRGIDAERVRHRAVAQNLISEADSQKLSKDQIYRFIFAPGFSTAEQVTSTSGRGVGMDVALVNISRLGGRIDIQTVLGQGTTFRLDMPLSAAMQTVLLAETAVQTVALPERMVVEAVTVARDSVQYVNGQRALLLHGRFLPLFRLTDLLRLPDIAESAPSTDMSLVVVAAEGMRYGVEVNRVLRRHEMLIRETHPRIAQLPGIGGVSTLGSDRIVLVIDPEGLTTLAQQAAVPGLRAARLAPVELAAATLAAA